MTHQTGLDHLIHVTENGGNVISIELSATGCCERCTVKRFGCAGDVRAVMSG